MATVQRENPMSTKTQSAQTLVSKVWSFCHMLRDDRVGYGDYLE